FISQRVRVSTYPDFEISGIPSEICSGDTLQLAALADSINTDFEVSVSPTQGSFQTTGVRSDSLPLPDGNGASYSTSVSFTDFAPGQILTDINDLLGICVNMEHSWMFDLEINLTCPDGTMVILQDQIQEPNEVFLGIPYEADDINGGFPPIQGIGRDYCWTPTATNGTWTEYVEQFDPATLPELNYNSFDPLDNLLGCPLNGEWIITVIDKWEQDNGWIFEWSIDFADELYPEVEQFTPEVVNAQWLNNPTIVHYEADSIVAVPQNAGMANYIFEVTDNFGCINDTAVLVDVLPFTHPDCYFCDETLSLNADTSICTGQQVQLEVGVPTSTQSDVLIFDSFVDQVFDHLTAPAALPLMTEIQVNSYTPNLLTDALSQINSVCVDLTHSFTADIDLWLQAPNGQLLELSTDNGGSGNNYTSTCFSPVATMPITAGTPPFTGSFVPEGDWTSLNGTPINGTWSLLVADDQAGFSGTINSWSISFTTEQQLTYTWTPSAGLSCTDCPQPLASPNVTTNYAIAVEDQFNCVR
ncbi:MAG: proprotein convertase P-domain-containing protein, partial [Bacteroidota bacterium]